MMSDTNNASFPNSLGSILSARLDGVLERHTTIRDFLMLLDGFRLRRDIPFAVSANDEAWLNGKGFAVSARIDAWRGVYEYPALLLSAYRSKLLSFTNLNDLRKVCSQRVFYGYGLKGGCYQYSQDSPLFIVLGTQHDVETWDIVAVTVEKDYDVRDLERATTTNFPEVLVFHCYKTDQ